MVSIRYLDFHCSVDAYPHTYRDFNVYDDEIQLNYFLGAILSIPMDQTHFLIPENIFENSQHLYLIGVPPNTAIPWINHLKNENIFDEIDPLSSLIEFEKIDNLEEFLRTLDMTSFPFLQYGKLYFESVLKQHFEMIVGVGPIGYDYTLLLSEESESKTTRFLQSIVLYVQIVALCTSTSTYDRSEKTQVIAEEMSLPEPPRGEVEAVDDSDVEDNELDHSEKLLPNCDPLISYSADPRTQSQKYILLSLNGPSSIVSRDLISVLSSLDSYLLDSSSPYLLIQLSSCTLTQRTIQYLLARYSNKIYFTVDGRITHSKQKNLREYIFDIPLENLVLESNCPLFPPISPPTYSEYPLPPLPEPLDATHHDRSSSIKYHPGYLLIIAATIGSIKRIDDIDHILDVIWRNTCQILGLKS